jgi:hypothetical protein
MANCGSCRERRCKLRDKAAASAAIKVKVVKVAHLPRPIRTMVNQDRADKGQVAAVVVVVVVDRIRIRKDSAN